MCSTSAGKLGQGPVPEACSLGQLLSTMGTQWSLLFWRDVTGVFATIGHV